MWKKKSTKIRRKISTKIRRKVSTKIRRKILTKIRRKISTEIRRKISTNIKKKISTYNSRLRKKKVTRETYDNSMARFNDELKELMIRKAKLESESKIKLKVVEKEILEEKEKGMNTISKVEPQADTQLTGAHNLMMLNLVIIFW